MASTAAATPARVAVVGAGAAGLVCAQVLRAAGMDVVVFERRAASVGGVWVHENGGAMYRNLRTNLPKEIMSYIGHPYDAALPSFVGHQDVARYLQSYSRDHGLEQHVQYSSDVIAARTVETEGTGNPLQARLGQHFLPWAVTVAESVTRAERTEQFDALLVCNGHFELPDSPSWPGLAEWPGRVLHAVDYDDPVELAGQSVLVVGTASSGTDIAWELTSVAKEVVVSQRSLDPEVALSPAEPPAAGRAPLAVRPAIEAFHPDGSVEFVGGCRVPIDAVVVCTGYVYDVPFVQLPSSVPAVPTPTAAAAAGSGAAVEATEEGSSLVGGGGRRLSWLWRHFVHAFVPSLCCIGLPYGIVPCQLFHCQALWLAALYTGALQLPSEGSLVADVEQHYESVAEQPGGWPRHAHRMGNGQWDYNRTLAREALAADPEQQQLFLRWLDANEEMNADLGRRRPATPGAADTYRDTEYTVDRQTGEWSCRPWAREEEEEEEEGGAAAAARL